MRGMTFLVLAMVLAGGTGSAELAARNDPQPRQGPMASPTVKSVPVNGTELSYVEQGRGEPVILIHGFFHDYRSWSDVAPELSKQYRVIAYSRRYHHPNPWPGGEPETSPSQDAEDLAALIGALKLGRAHLIGHSAGAGIALLVARDHPGLVRSVVLGEPLLEAMLARSPEAALLPPPAFFASAQEAFQRGDDEGGLRILAEGIVGKKGAYDDAPLHRRQRLHDNLRLGKVQMSRPRAPLPFTCEEAQAIKAPALLLEGEDTLKMFHLASAELRKCMPRSEHAVLPAATHGLQLENPTGFNEIVLKFLARHSGESAPH
ncbi:MAG: alpha/beta fold hydrolase [Candidatus Acidiferrales bacterium]